MGGMTKLPRRILAIMDKIDEKRCTHCGMRAVGDAGPYGISKGGLSAAFAYSISFYI